jgi:hypothetical protein
MAERIGVSICSPPHRQRHVAEIALVTDEILEPGTHGTYCPIGEIIVEDGKLEFEINPVAESERRRFDLIQLMAALEEGKRRLLERWPVS